MNLVLLEASDFTDADHVRLTGRRRRHVMEVHRAAAGETLRVGLLAGRIGRAQIEKIDADALELHVDALDDQPPTPLPLRLILALPRPKVLNRTLAAAAALGIKEIDLINAWRVEKAYWSSPRLSADNIRMQLILGLEQAVDTVLPVVRMHRLFTPFVREQLPQAAADSLALLAHPEGGAPCPRSIEGPAILAIGPEGGFIEREVGSFKDAGFSSVTLGSRILRVETALAYLVGRLF